MAAAANRPRCFFDIDIGDPVKFSADQAAYARTCEFLTTQGASLGLDSSSRPESLDDESRDMLLDAYSSQPAWKAKGDPRAAPADPLRAGRIVFELFADDCPLATKNFQLLCTGEKGTDKESGKPLHFKNTRLFRIVKGFIAQGGDVTRGDGSGGACVVSKSKTFNDEKPGLTKHKHSAAGILSMANSGKNSNTSQFFLTLAAAPQCDGKHVVFGRVVEGLDIVSRINDEAASDSGNPLTVVSIADSGLL